jgi:hypothetical protein
MHPGTWPLVCDFCGGADDVRTYEFNFRESPAGAGRGRMNFHHGPPSHRKPVLPQARARSRGPWGLSGRRRPRRLGAPHAPDARPLLSGPTWGV